MHAMTTRRDFLKGVIGTVLASGATARAEGWLDNGGERPNFIFIITDDISPEDLGCYGNEAIETPHIDRLARDGVRFTNAYLSISSCSPSRCSIITGRYPHNTGAAELHTTLPDDQLRFPELLRKVGYYTALSGKNHMGDMSGAFDLISSGKGPGREDDWVDIVRNRPADKPFFFWFASSDAHRGWKKSETIPKYDPASVTVPPYLYDGARTRKDLADYYHEVSRTDFHVGALMEELKEQGLSRSTYVIYCSDNGRPFPRCKTRLTIGATRKSSTFCAPCSIAGSTRRATPFRGIRPPTARMQRETRSTTTRAEPCRAPRKRPRRSTVADRFWCNRREISVLTRTTVDRRIHSTTKDWR